MDRLGKQEFERLVWNRAALEDGGSNPSQGDASLAGLLYLHSLVMNGGVHHALSILDETELSTAADALQLLGFREAAIRLVNHRDDPVLGVETDETERLADEWYFLDVGDDTKIYDAFVRVYRGTPELFSAVGGEREK